MVSGVVLAAGASSRMGEQKLLLDLGGETIVRRTVRQVCDSGVDDVLVVVGHEHEKVLEALEGLPIRYALNTKYRDGMGTSFRTAIEHAGGSEAVLIALADQPFVTAAHYRAILDTFREQAPAIVGVRYGDVTAPPHLFSKELFPELLELVHGARPVIERHGDRRLVLQFPPELLQDIDTPQDYEVAKARWSRTSSAR
jgi:molybdenum cofactor cytidylyltransferase